MLADRSPCIWGRETLAMVMVNAYNATVEVSVNSMTPRRNGEIPSPDKVF